MPVPSWTYAERATLFLIKTRWVLSYDEARTLFYRVYPNKKKADKKTELSAQNLEDEFAQRHGVGKAVMWKSVDEAAGDYTAEEKQIFADQLQAITDKAANEPAITLTAPTQPYGFGAGTTTTTRNTTSSASKRQAKPGTRAPKKRSASSEEEEEAAFGQHDDDTINGDEYSSLEPKRKRTRYDTQRRTTRPKRNPVDEALDQFSNEMGQVLRNTTNYYAGSELGPLQVPLVVDGETGQRPAGMLGGAFDDGYRAVAPQGRQARKKAIPPAEHVATKGMPPTKHPPRKGMPPDQVEGDGWRDVIGIQIIYEYGIHYIIEVEDAETGEPLPPIFMRKWETDKGLIEKYEASRAGQKR